MKRVIAIVCLCFILSAAGFAEGLSLKLTGGMYYLTGGDYNNIIQGRTDYYHSLSSLNITSDLKKLTLCANFGLEFILDITDNIGIGLGAGFLHATNDGTMQAKSGSVSIQEEFTPLVTAFPVMLNLHVTIPITEKMHIHLSGGPGVTFSTFQFDRTTIDSSLTLDETLSFDSKTRAAFGFQGTLGLEYAISDSVYMILDANARSAVASGFKGPWSLIGSWEHGAIGASGSSPVWYEEVQGGANYYPDMVVKDTAPIASSLRNVRSARISLGGIGVQVGLKFYL
jgi:opacity protein-like surface antigen